MKNNGWFRLHATLQAFTLVSLEVGLLSDAKGTDRPSFRRSVTLTVGSGLLMHCPPTPIPHPPWGIWAAVNFCRVPALQWRIFDFFVLFCFFDKTGAAEQALPVRLSPAALPCESSHITLSHNQQTRIPNVALPSLPPCCQDLSNFFGEPWKKKGNYWVFAFLVCCFVLFWRGVWANVGVRMSNLNSHLSWTVDD